MTAPAKYFGRYALLSLDSRGPRSSPELYWELHVDPAVAIRLKRIFGRVQATTTGTIRVRHTMEVARDLAWMMERWPLEAETAAAHELLHGQAQEHREREARVEAISSGEFRQSPIPRPPAKEPRPYQLAALELLRTTKRLLLADEVGLGKTLTALLAATIPEALPILVVPPTHLPRRWESEVRESFPWLRCQTAKKTSPGPRWDPQHMPDVFIVPYSRLSGWQHHLRGVARTVIFDEAQELRTGVSTNKGTAAASIAAEAEFVLGLSATPVYNYGGEVWELYNIIAPDALGTKSEFTREWGHAINNGHISVSSPAALGSYLRSQGLMLGRSRKQVGLQLPQVVKVAHTVDSNPAALQAIKGDAVALAKLILSDTTSARDRFVMAGELDWKLREATGVAKAPYVAEFVRLLLESEEKVVLFGWHRAVYDIWRQGLKDFNPVMYTGSESPMQKARTEDRFVNDPSCRVMIMSLRSGAGVDGLQKVSRTAVFGELDWSPQVHAQGIGRLRRDGMGDDPVVAYFLTSDQGSDLPIMDVLQVKRQQGEPLTTDDGKLGTTTMPDQSRARLLAQQLLGVAPEQDQLEIA